MICMWLCVFCPLGAWGWRVWMMTRLLHRGRFCLHFRTSDIARPWPAYHPCDIECSSAVVAKSQSFAFDMRLWDSLGSVKSHRRGQRRRSSTQKSPQGFKLILDTNTFRCIWNLAMVFSCFFRGDLSQTIRKTLLGASRSAFCFTCVFLCALQVAASNNWAEMPRIASFYVLYFRRYWL